MAPIPVICDNCGQTWISNNLIGVGAGSTAHITMTNTTLAPCPYCGGSGHTIDGDYLITSDSVQIFTGLPDPIKQLLAAEFQRAKESEVGPVVRIAEIPQSRSPKFPSLSRGRLVGLG